MSSAAIRFLADENIEYRLVEWLRSLGYDVVTIVETERGITDEDVLSVARSEGRIILTNDRDFGELIVSRRLSHCGVIYMRMQGLALAAKIGAMEQLLCNYKDRLPGSFTTLREGSVRFRR